MKANYFNRFCHALVAATLAAVAFEFLPEARAFIVPEGLPAGDASTNAQWIFTNTAPQAIPRRASIIFIQCDGLGYGDLSCDGQTNFQTPNIDRLAAEGMRFTNYFAGVAGSPAHAAVLLGKDPAHLRQRADGDVPLASDETTVAQILENSGYVTRFYGEWDLGDENSTGAPWKKGFDGFGGYFDPNDAENFYADYVWRYAPKSIFNETNQQMGTFMGKETLVPNLGGAKGEYIPDALTKAALNFVKIYLPDPFNHYRPFFLLLNYKIPGDGKSQVPTDAPFSEENWPQPEKNKAAMIARLDGYVGQLQEQLNNLGMTNNVVIFFTSDTISKKGGGVDPAFFHSNLATNDLRVPMIVRWPDHIPAGTVSGFKWSAKDFLPTAAEIGYTKSPAGVDGASVLPVLLGQTKK